ncbi:MAG: response regulator [Acidobacteriota bacterium]|nr:response regulator [Acidobacteriota bacterium]
MSSEQSVPEVQVHQGLPPAQIGSNGSGQDTTHSIAHGMGQSKSSRRRRRKRKNKGGDSPVAAASGAQAPAQFTGEMQASAGAAVQFQPQSGFHQAGGGQQQAGQGTKRWKKKFRDRDRRGASQENPGNQASAGSGSGYSNGGGAAVHREKDTHQPGNTAGGFKRKGGGGKQRDRGPRGFVGPMDHSYRAVNGNFADGPPSTLDSQGFFGRNGGGGGGGRAYVADSQPIDYSVGRPVPIPDDAPTKIFFFIEDLFFNAKITETARKLGVKVAFVKNDKEAIAALTSMEDEADRPGLIVFDLNNANVKPLTLIPKLKSKLKKSTSIIGFLSHIQGDLKAKAVEAGCDTVMARAAFSQNLPNLLRRYGLHEEEEDNFNQ